MPRIFRHHIHRHVLAQVAAEGAVVLASFFVSLHLDAVGFGTLPATRAWPLAPAVTSTALVLIALYLCELYDIQQDYGRRETALRLILAFAGAYVVIAATGYLAPVVRVPRSAYIVSFVLALSAAFFVRLTFAYLMNSTPGRRRLLLVGSGGAAQIIAQAVNGSHPRYEMVGCVDGQAAGGWLEREHVRILGTVEDLGRVSRAIQPDVIVVALTERRQSLPIPAILACKLEGIEVEDWPNFYEKLMGKIHLTELRPSWLIFSDGFKKSNVTLAVKRGMDVLLAVLGLVLTLPLFPLIALLIKRDSPGPVFYRQERLGKGGRIFRLIKFRSMRCDAESTTGPVWAGEHDPRVTRVGRVLRRARLDEVPQLINVLRGEMSVVGPRPERPAFVSQLQEKVPFYIHRLAMKPGVTGWAQVKYRYGSSVEDALEKLQYDLYYIKNLSVFLDLLILLQTVQIVLLGRGSR
jgi:sugar transferase (PEP-CTERM system associated)